MGLPSDCTPFTAEHPYPILSLRHSQNHPRELLRLLLALLDPAVQLHDWKLRRVLEEISAACPACTDGLEYRKIDYCFRQVDHRCTFLRVGVHQKAKQKSRLT